MNVLTITREHLDNNGYYKGPDVTNFDGAIVLEPDLGTVEFTTGVSASGSIRAGRGTDIVTGKGIKVGGDILFVGSVQAGWGIYAGKSISVDNLKSNGDIEAGGCIYATGNINTAKCIISKCSIEAGFIDAGGAIKAGFAIKARKGVRTGSPIECKTLSAGFPIFD